jgi:hypothetical protein
MIRKFSDVGGAVCCWDSCRCPRPVAEGAFKGVGQSDCLPKVNRLAAIHEAAKVVAKESDLCKEGMPNLKYFTLDRSSLGVGVYQEIRGKEENEYPFVFSAGVSDETGEATILKASHLFTASRYAASTRLDGVYQNAAEFLTASDVTKGINRLLGKSHAVGLRDNGSVFFIPGEFIERYNAVADALKAGGPQLHCWVVDLSANERLLRTVHDNMIHEVVDRMTKRQADWSEFVTAGGKAQERGLQSRFDAMLEDARQIEFYEKFLATNLDALREALEQQQAMIGMAHLDLWNANADGDAS